MDLSNTFQMSPFLQARAVYDREHCARDFEEDLLAHLMGGIVINTPDLFLMGREVESAAPHAQIVDPWHRFEGETDTWMVYLYAGRLSDILRYCPYPKESVAFERNNVLRFHSFRSLQRLCPTSTSTSTDPTLTPT